MANLAYQYILASVFTISSTACSGNSRPDAIVTEVAGLPCFAIPENRETRGGIPLYGLLVSERPSSESTLPPSELWSVSVEPAGASIVARPHSCIRYGETPLGAVAGTPLTLQPHHVYGIDLNARPENSNVHSYSAQFCIRLVGGKSVVQVIPWNDKSNQWQYNVCNKL
ncbi:hypothetical protein [Massilia sp. TWP1-3-3]|uniref:hypothetical protein n=1 Tax=Massilia sp. TWP1-3-3 TaxID=2804573 RepID=UPI003CF2F9DC